MLDSLRPSRLHSLLGYAGMIAGVSALFAAVLHFGAALDVPLGPAPATSVRPDSAAHDDVLAHVLLALAVITVVARLVALAFGRFLGQPPVMGEIVAGIALGPSVLGAIAPSAQAFLLPAGIAPHLGIVAKIGVVIFMFLVGLELDTKRLRESSHATIAISHASIVAPFLLGATLALGLYGEYGMPGTSFTVFALFVGVSMSVTAFPVLARILTDRELARTELGTTALACAAIDDATAWCLLAFVSGIATAQLGSAFQTVFLVVVYLVVMYAFVRPVAERIAAREEVRETPVSRTVLAVTFGLLLLSACATEALGIHALFGAFVFGVVLPHDGRLSQQLRERLEDVVVVLLLPVFFAFTGMRTELGRIDTARDVIFCALIIVVATLGKFGGTFLAARASGLGSRDASALGILMNTRGLMELIVLNVGLDMGVLSPRLFAMLVVMALVTTFTTTPLLNRILAKRHAPVDAAGPSGDVA